MARTLAASPYGSPLSRDGVHTRLSGAGRFALDGRHMQDSRVQAPRVSKQPPLSAAASENWARRSGQRVMSRAASTSAIPCSLRPGGDETPSRRREDASSAVAKDDSALQLAEFEPLADASLEGGVQSLQQWCKQWQVQHQRLQRSNAEAALAREHIRTSLLAKSVRVKGVTAPNLEWSSLNSASRRALKSWVAGHIGGRHCLMLLQHDSAIAFLVSPLDVQDVSASDLKGSAIWSALAGLPLDAQGSRDASWLYGEVFAKSPVQVFQDALQAALQEAADPWWEKNGGLGAEQVNLSLRRLAVKAQAAGMQRLIAGEKGEGSKTRCTEEFLRTQVWLEVVRINTEPVEDEPAFGPKGQPMKSTALVAKTPSSNPASCWDDGILVGRLGKNDMSLQDEAKKMSYDALRRQNHMLEYYLMRLVRQRDSIKQIAHLAEQCDSYRILGLDGPAVTDDEVKKAYRNLARKEHPDKAGMDNKERFQRIQQAYAAVLKERKSEDASETGAATSPEKPAASIDPLSRLDEKSQQPAGLGAGLAAFAQEAADHAAKACRAADAVALAAQKCFGSSARAVGARGQPKKTALREMQHLTKLSAQQLLAGAEMHVALKEHACVVVKCVETGLKKYGQWAETSMPGAGLCERCELLLESAKACSKIAEHLRKLQETDAEMLTMVFRHGGAESDAVNALRMLSESVGRTATVMRCAADKAMGAASAALDVSCSLATLDREHSEEEREKAEAVKKQREREMDSPRLGASGGDKSGGGGSRGEDGAISKTSSPRDGKDSSKDDKDDDEDEKDSRKGSKDAVGSKGSDKKEEQVLLRTRNLKCLGSLNEEVLELQGKLRSMLLRDESFAPSVAASQKGSIFDLIGQLLHFAVAEVGRLVLDSSISHAAVLERAFAFVLALEHTREVGLHSEVQTQVLKMAALFDESLLCQIFEGPLKKRLLCSGPRRNGGQGAPAPAWAEAVHAFCERVLCLLRGQRESCATKPVVASG
eukprot:TRINITY_DN24872_c0_g1_i1.p1 TRINITY_DN24872_c0_g1~~TRINITY_DN24872_c0_g1_i1.p1  ORF type:complete len:992 (+),score=245.87 TRINITY_DN24872_c0_g1_i1:58-3033(+)